MDEITVESRARVEENGRMILYEKRYRGVLDGNGGLRLRAFVWKRAPLTNAQSALLPASNLEDAARAA